MILWWFYDILITPEGFKCSKRGRRGALGHPSSAQKLFSHCYQHRPCHGQEENLLFAPFKVELAGVFYQMEGAAGWDWLWRKGTKQISVLSQGCVGAKKNLGFFNT